VLPFTVRGGEALAYLGDGIVNLLGAALDGAGSWRPADARATFAAVREAGGPALDTQSGNRVAKRLRAGMYVLGDVIEAGGQLQIEAAVYSVGGGCGLGSRANTLVECAAPEPLTKAVVTGAVDSAFTLVDRLAARLLGGLRGGGFRLWGRGWTNFGENFIALLSIFFHFLFIGCLHRKIKHFLIGIRQVSLRRFRV